jgi:hypothetical protein
MKLRIIWLNNSASASEINKQIIHEVNNIIVKYPDPNRRIEIHHMPKDKDKNIEYETMQATFFYADNTSSLGYLKKDQWSYPDKNTADKFKKDMWQFIVRTNFWTLEWLNGNDDFKQVTSI